MRERRTSERVVAPTKKGNYSSLECSGANKTAPSIMPSTVQSDLPSAPPSTLPSDLPSDTKTQKKKSKIVQNKFKQESKMCVR